MNWMEVLVSGATASGIARNVLRAWPSVWPCHPRCSCETRRSVQGQFDDVESYWIHISYSFIILSTFRCKWKSMFIFFKKWSTNGGLSISMWFFACNRIWSTQSVGIGRQNFVQFLNNHMFSVPARLQMVAMQYRSCRMQPGNGCSTQKETCRIFYQVHFQRQTVGFWQIRTKLSTS